MSVIRVTKRLGPGSPSLDRRTFLAGTGSAGFLALAGCGGDDGGTPALAPGPAPAPAPAPAPSPSPTPGPATASTRFGVNYFDLFYAQMHAKASFDPLRQLRELKDRGITLVRFSASPFWPNEWRAWDRAPEEQLKALDQVYDAADTLGMDLIPTFVWHLAGISDYLGERYSAWGDANSRSRVYFDQHVRRMVQRHLGRASLLMWECANEFNVWADLPNGHTLYPVVAVDSGTFAERTSADDISIGAVQSTYQHFERLVRTYDDRRLIVSGSGIPRENQIRGASGEFGHDTRAELAQAMEQTMASEHKTLSVHLYDDQASRYFDANGSTFPELLGIARQTADKHGAKLILGEFGVPKSADDTADRTRFRAMLAEVRAAKVDYALAWNYDWDKQSEWSISAANGRDWMLDELAAANRG